MESLGKIKYFEKWAVLAMKDTPNRNSGRYETEYYKNCIQAISTMRCQAIDGI